LVSLERIRRRGGAADEFEKLEALQAVRRIFLSLRRPFIRVVDAGRGLDVVGAECGRIVRELLERHDPGP
jgi:thymidylate kinase